MTPSQSEMARIRKVRGMCAKTLQRPVRMCRNQGGDVSFLGVRHVPFHGRGI